MGYFIEGNSVPSVSSHRWWKVSSLQRQRERVGLSLMCCAFLLNMHETSLMNLEMGSTLPSSDVLGRMQLLGYVLDGIADDTVTAHINLLEQAAYHHIAHLPLESRLELSDDVSFFLSSKRLFDEVVQRETVLSLIVSSQGH